ncbi:unnamed protein product, partial [Ixodes persulcatus]
MEVAHDTTDPTVQENMQEQLCNLALIRLTKVGEKQPNKNWLCTSINSLQRPLKVLTDQREKAIKNPTKVKL